MVKNIFSLSVLVLLFSCTADIKPKESEGLITLDTEVIYPKIRRWTTPSFGLESSINSPSFQWPSTKHGVYAIRISTSREFNENLIQIDDIPFALYNVHRALEEGKWFWQYKVNNGSWNELDSFLITESTPHFVTPSIQSLLAKIPTTHPRVLARKADINAFRERASQYKETKMIIDEADGYLGNLPPKESSALPTYEGKNDFENKKIASLASKWAGWHINRVLDVLSQAYQLTGDRKYFETAKDWMLEVAGWDPKGPSHTNNFGDSGIMTSLAIGADTFWELLTDHERKSIIKQAATRADQFYQLWISQVESRSSSMHVWQHILHRMFSTSLALKGEVPEAELWLEFIYELWIAQSPKMAEGDGAWFNGTGYFRMNTLTMYEINTTLEELSGIDFMWSSWYRNNPRWMIYAFPPKSIADGFCNDGNKHPEPTINYAGYADAAARKFNDPYASWYASQVSAGLGLGIEEDDEFRWFRIQRAYQNSLPEPIKEFNLPQAASFPDVGVAYMHTALQDPQNDLMFSIRSSPFASLAHTHADQNTFNIAYGGERLFYNTGYRPAMGDPHFMGWYKHTQGHNGVLIDGKGQPFDEAAYGWLPRFLHGKQISYAVGDASHAYSGIKQEKTEVGLELFRRHYLMIRPGIIVIYDELEADHEVEWSWLLHNDQGFKIDMNTIFAENSATKAKVSIYSSAKVDFEVTDQFSVPVDNWTNKIDEEGDTINFENQWHFTAVTSQKTNKMRFLAIFQIQPDGIYKTIDESEGVFKVGNWEISAELNTNRPAAIYVNDMGDSVAFSSQGSLKTTSNKFRNLDTGSAKLLEVIDGKSVFQESNDTLPYAIKQVLSRSD